MKRIFRNYPIANDVAEVFHYDYSDSISSCMKSMNGIFHSQNLPVNLNLRSKRHTLAVPGWDFDNGNILSLPTKICEWAVGAIEDDYYIAYTYWSGNSLILLVSKVHKRLWLNPEINAFDCARNILTIKKGINSHLRFDGAKFLWRTYETAVISSSYKSYFYDIVHGNVVQTSNTSTVLKNGYPRQLLIEHGRAHFVFLRRCGIYCIHIYPKKRDIKAPAIVICLGGPFIKVPDIRFLPNLYHHFSNEGYHVIIPLRRGVIGLSSEWEQELYGRYGIADVEDILSSTREFVMEFEPTVDSNRLGLYGASYGGYSALLINGKHNKELLFKSVVSHCGVYDLSTYPFHSSGNARDIMMEYGHTDDIVAYAKNVIDINPASFVNDWNVSTLLVHTIDDTTTWFGQSVSAYNAALKNHCCNISLILTHGGHSYNISKEEAIEDAIVNHFNTALKTQQTKSLITI